MSTFWSNIDSQDPFANTENFGPMLPNGRNAYDMSKEDIYFALHGKTQKQVQKEMRAQQDMRTMDIMQND